MIATAASPAISFRPLLEEARLDSEALGSAHEASCERASKKVELSAGQLSFAAGDWRSALIEGPKIAIVNLFFYPEPSRLHPVFAMEFVRFANRGIVAVIDLKNTAPEALPGEVFPGILREAKARHGFTENASEAPEWYRECRSGEDLFLRPEVDVFPALSACFRHVWAAYVDALLRCPRLSPQDSQRHYHAQQLYKDHHRENSPGLPFLNRTFGPSWTDTFLRQHHFA